MAFKLPPDFMDQVQQTQGTRIIFEDLDCLLKDKHSVLLSAKGSERCVCARERRRFDLGEEAEMRVEHSRTMME